jgi:serine/threonine protein kinase
MTKCTRCFAEFDESAAACPACGLSTGDSNAETAVLTPDPQANTPTRLETSSKEDHLTTAGRTTRFVSGTVLVGRYRIVGLVGKGGMGEVYKAEDLELDQTVALKFLPEELSKNDELLRRFRGEVRNARQVSHRNVCRVFDIGETDGLYYITMEYIDGDDLSMLLKRIGRLPADKAVEISREICMGLAAIHKAGILHRDIKPANIIIDSKGEARITDFGIAGIEAEIHGIEARVGTPAYMSPEQIDGREITQRSDIYSLGLLLYEIFTGRQAFEGDSVQELQVKQATTSPRNPSEIVTGINPLVENVIKRCLEKDPNQRPETALKVAMSLPGGDPLQIALEAGQTPSPEMVAASPKKGALRPATAAALLAVIIFGIAVTIAISKGSYVNRIVPLEKRPEALTERSRDLTRKFGYLEGDSYSGFVKDNGYIDHLKKTDNSTERWQKLAAGEPPTIRFWFRSSPQPLRSMENAIVTRSDPPNNLGGMALVVLDTKGRLFGFSGIPPRADARTPIGGEFDWAGVLREAGLDPAAFQSVDPQWTPPTAFDQRRAFSGTYPDNVEIPIRVDVASYRGKLVHFEIVEPWTKAPEEEAGESSYIAPFIGAGIYFSILALSCWLAVKNVRGGRSDVKGTIRVAAVLFAMRMLSWSFATHHVASLSEISLIIVGIQSGLYWAVTAGLMYLAFEPFLRRRSPERIISWSRLLAGDWRDPLIGRDLLIGGAAGSMAAILWAVLTYYIPLWRGWPVSLNITAIQGPGERLLAGTGGFPMILLDSLSVAVIGTFIASFLILFVGMLLRRTWLGVGAVVLIVGAIQFSVAGAFDNVLETAANLIIAISMVLIAARFGVMAMLSMFVFTDVLVRPVTSELTSWYAGEFFLFALFVVLSGVFGFYTSTAGQKLWQGKFLGEFD